MFFGKRLFLFSWMWEHEAVSDLGLLTVVEFVAEFINMVRLKARPGRGDL